MQVNDDAAERAARRRSAHFAPMLPDKEAAPHKSALSVQKRAKRLSAVAPSNPPVSMEVMNTNFEEWMKLATDNVSFVKVFVADSRKSQQRTLGTLP